MPRCGLANEVAREFSPALRKIARQATSSSSTGLLGLLTVNLALTASDGVIIPLIASSSRVACSWIPSRRCRTSGPRPRDCRRAGYHVRCAHHPQGVLARIVDAFGDRCSTPSSAHREFPDASVSAAGRFSATPRAIPVLRRTVRLLELIYKGGARWPFLDARPPTVRHVPGRAGRGIMGIHSPHLASPINDRRCRRCREIAEKSPRTRASR